MTSPQRDTDPGAGKLDLGQVRDLVRLLADACELRGGGTQCAHYLVSGLARILDAELMGSVFGLACAAPPEVDWNSAATALPAFDAPRACAPVIHAFMRMTPSEPGIPITATYHQILHAGQVSTIDHVPPDLRALGVAHLLLSSVRLTASDRLHALGLSRAPLQPAFRAEERNLVHVFHRACEHLLRAPAARVTAAPRTQLSPRERQTLELVLIGLSDKEIADRLGISRHTVNQYTKVIYRHYGVTSRPLLLARLLGQPAAGPP